jgi:hypothetical protein
MLGGAAMASTLPLRKPAEYLGGVDLERREATLERFRQVDERMLPFWQMYPPMEAGAFRRIERSGAQLGQRDVAKVRFLGIRVDFGLEDPDDPNTTGNGLMRLTDNGEDSLIVDTCGFESFNPLYDPPHDKTYFLRMLESAANYFHLSTFGQMICDFAVVPEADTAAYTLPHPMSYYGDPDNFELALVTLFRDAIKVADQDTIIRDWDDLDPDSLGNPVGDGVPDYQQGTLVRIVLFHAGSAWQTDIMWDTEYDIAAVYIPPGAVEYYLGSPFILANSARDTIWDCCVMPEMMSQDGVEVKMQGILAHENMHNIFVAPDLYDIYGRASGIGAWGQMATGVYVGYPPGIPEGLITPLPNAWERVWMDYAMTEIWWPEVGFLNDSIMQSFHLCETPQELSIRPAAVLTDSLGEFIEDLSVTRFYKFPINEHEYYLVENKLDNLPQNDTVICGDTAQVFGDWKDGVVVHFHGEQDYLLPGKGLLVWHVDEDIIWDNFAWNEINSVRPMGVDLEEADGIQDLEKWTDWPYTWYGSPYDAYFDGNRTEFSDSTDPASLNNFGGHTFVRISGVSEPCTLMTFTAQRSCAQPGFPVHLGDTTFVHENPQGDEFIRTYEPEKCFIAAAEDSIPRIVVAQSIRSDTIVDIYGEPADTIRTDTVIQIHVLSGAGEVLFSDTLWNVGKLQGAPALHDLDGDGTLEMVMGFTGRRVVTYRLSGDLAELWHLDLPDAVRGTPSILPPMSPMDSARVLVGCDDQQLYIIAADGQIEDSVRLGAPARNTAASSDSLIAYLTGAGQLCIIGSDGELRSTLLDPSAFETRSSPAIGDVDRDGEEEVLVATGLGFLHRIDFGGEIDWSRELGGPVQTSPALGDLTGDGYLEVCLAAGSQLYAFNHRGSLLSGFPLDLDLEMASDTDTVHLNVTSPLIADIDGDGSQDILLGVSRKGIHAFDRVGSPIPGFPLGVSGNLDFPPALFDIDDDPDLELLIVDSAGMVFAYEIQDTLSHWRGFGDDPGHTFRFKTDRYGPEPGAQEDGLSVSRVFLYPNPTYDGETTVRFRTTSAGDLKVRVFSYNGVLLRDFEYTFSGGIMEDAKPSMDLRDLASGVYFVHCEFDGSGETETRILKLGIVR